MKNVLGGTTYVKRSCWISINNLLIFSRWQFGKWNRYLWWNHFCAKKIPGLVYFLYLGIQHQINAAVAKFHLFSRNIKARENIISCKMERKWTKSLSDVNWVVGWTSLKDNGKYFVSSFLKKWKLFDTDVKCKLYPETHKMTKDFASSMQFFAILASSAQAQPQAWD